MKFPRLILNNYGLRRDNKFLLQNISFTLQSVEVLSVIGPQKSGKGLFVKSLLGLHTGTVVGSLKTVGSQRFGLVSKNYACVEEFSLFQNLSLVSRLAGVDLQAHLAEEVEEVLKTVGLWSKHKNDLHKKTSILNAFEKTLLNLARTLLLKPTILILDQPTLKLDPVQKAQFESVIEKLKNSMSFIWINHDLEQVARMSDQVLFLQNGNMIECASCETFFTMPMKEDSENFISGRINV
ncbi:ATP-binding cassette domain-containing protein [bacterium]|nr:ATP-binding cassette domain-containing protein [bacterium]